MKIEIAIQGPGYALTQLCRELDCAAPGMAYFKRGMDGPKPEVVLLESEKSVEDQLRAISQITRRLERVPSLEGRFKFRVRNQMDDMESFFMDEGLFTRNRMVHDGWGLLVMNIRKR